jgi:hypothetical protein
MSNNKSKSSGVRSMRRPRRVRNPWASYIQPSQSIVHTRLTYEDAITSSAGGNILRAIAIYPASASEFASYQTLYDEYRVVGGVVTLFTVAPFSTSGSSPTNGLIAVSYDFNDGNVPSAVSDVLSQGNRSLFQALSMDRRPYRYNFRTPTSGQNTSISWTPTASPVPTGSVKFAASGLTASRDYVELIFDIYVQFRGRV